MSELPNAPSAVEPTDDELVDPAVWADESRIHGHLAWLRANDPLRKLSPNGYAPFYAVTRYDDIKAVEQDKAGFICDPRPTLAPLMSEAFVQSILPDGQSHLIRSLVQMDDPDHMKYRMLTQSWFMGSNLRRLQSRVDSLAKLYVDRLEEMGGECDFVKDVAIWYPLRVIMDVLGVPEEDEPFMMKLTQELFGSQDPEVQRSFELSAIKDIVDDFEGYFRKLTAARKNDPKDDIATLIANAQIDGEPIPDLEANGYYTIIATAGHDTTSNSAAGGLLALMQNPDQFERLRSDVDAHLPTAIDEMIRWVTPVRHFMRTATADKVIGGQAISEGESVILWYPSANRDEAVFDAPFEFRVDRRDAKQLAFGFGGHVCLGQHLARMEISALFRELFSRVEHFELAGEPKYTHSTFVGGLKSLPIRYRMR